MTSVKTLFMDSGPEDSSVQVSVVYVDPIKYVHTCVRMYVCMCYTYIIL